MDVQADMTGYLDEQQFQEALGIGQSYDPRSQRELAANFFAAELLLPFERIRTLYLLERVLSRSIGKYLWRLTGSIAQSSGRTTQATRIYSITNTKNISNPIPTR